MRPFSIPNFFSMIRILLIPFFFLSMYYYLIGMEMMLWLARITLVIIVISDFLDGYLARRLQETSTFGSVLDPVADKLFVTASFVLLTVFDKISEWLTITVVAKDLLVIIGWLLLAMLYQKVGVNPSLLGKAATALQFLTVIAIVILPAGFNSLWLEFITGTVTIAALFLYAYQTLQFVGGLNGKAETD